MKYKNPNTKNVFGVNFLTRFRRVRRTEGLLQIWFLCRLKKTCENVNVSTVQNHLFWLSVSCNVLYFLQLWFHKLEKLFYLRDPVCLQIIADLSLQCLWSASGLRAENKRLLMRENVAVSSGVSELFQRWKHFLQQQQWRRIRSTIS